MTAIKPSSQKQDPTPKILEDSANMPTRPRWPQWPTLLSMLTVLVAVGTVALHVVGAASHRAYMQYWGIDASTFPKSTDLILIDGYYSLMNQSAYAFVQILKHVGLWISGALGLALYLFVLLSPWDAGVGKASAWVARQARSLQRLVRCLIITLVLAAVVPFMIIGWTLVMVFPDSLGQVNGRQHAEREAVDYVKGCEKSIHSCVELKKGDRLLATGFVLDGSPLFVAIFDAHLQRARIVPREGLEMISARPPVLPAVR